MNDWGCGFFTGTTIVFGVFFLVHLARIAKLEKALKKTSE